MGEGEIRFVDLFAGVGGFHLGLAEANSGRERISEQRKDGGCVKPRGDTWDAEVPSNHGFKCVWANEWDKYAASVYRWNFPETPLSTDDIRAVPADSIPDHDLLCAGFPCQAFSVAGRRRGFEEARGTLFYEIARIAECKRPRLLLLENVKGLLSHDGGKTFAIILRVLGVSVTDSNGRCLILTGSVSPRTGRGCSLSGILEPNPPERYFLSQKLVESLLKHGEEAKAKGNGFGPRIHCLQDMGKMEART